MKSDSLNIIPRPKQAVPKWINIVIWALAFLVLILGGVFLYLGIQKSIWENRIKERQVIYAALSNAQNLEVESKVKSISSQLKKFSAAFQNHKASHKIFAFLREYCHLDVHFLDMSLNVETGDVLLSAQASSYDSLSEQIIILEKVEQVSNLEISDILLNKEGKVAFKMKFKIKPEFFLNQAL